MTDHSSKTNPPASFLFSVFFAIALLRPAVAAEAPAASRQAGWENIHSFCYQLQDIDLKKMGESHYDVVIIDYSDDGSDQTAYTAAQIHALKNSPGGPKKVLAYLSIGEAEDFRFYWSPAWVKPDGTLDALAPPWLGPENADWPGDYHAKYWDPAWPKILKLYIDKIMAAGFDGVFLDSVDSYEYWGTDGESGLNRASAEQDMVNLVKDLAHYTRVEKHTPNFAIFAQNGADLAPGHPLYLHDLTGVAAEDTWYDDDNPNDPQDIADTLRNLDIFKKAGKPVFVMDYVTTPAHISDFIAKAQSKGYIPFVTNRDLDHFPSTAPAK